MTEEVIDFPEFVAMVTGALQATGVEYMIGGALALWAWGEPRSTMDLDLRVAIPVEAIPRLSDRFRLHPGVG